ncbi:MAG TPA: hypothetical protein ENI87_04385 [bacterium]|nr:hypothetical protein [bacterium]
MIVSASIRNRLIGLLVPMLAVCACPVDGCAQKAVAGGSINKVTGSNLPTLASMAQAVLSQDYTVEQLRRFRDENGNVVTVRERLEVDTNGTPDPKFAVTFLDVVGEPTGSPLYLEWQQAYSRFGELFFKHASFRVRDLVGASANYTLHDFGPVVRAGRVARRMVVFPNAGDKAIWVVDVDSITSVPLFVAEFDSQLQIFAEIEVVTFSNSVGQIPQTLTAANITSVPCFQAALPLFNSTAGLIDPDTSAVADYNLAEVEVHDDPINGDQKLVMTYTDGIDEFMVVQAVNQPDPFSGLPGSGANVIGRFRDPAVSALVFWDDNVAFQVAGRGSLQRLDSVARNIYVQALAN